MVLLTIFIFVILFAALTGATADYCYMRSISRERKKVWAALFIYGGSTVALIAILMAYFNGWVCVF